MPRAARPVDGRDGLAAALGQFVIHSPTVFAFAGEAAVDVRMAAQAPMARRHRRGSSAGSDSRHALRPLLRATLCRRGSASAPGPGATRAADSAFGRRLIAANAGREYWDGGWFIHQFGPNGQAFVRKGDRERIAMPGAFIFAGPPGQAPQIGSAVSLRVPHETFDVQPGYYFAFGGTLDELADNLTLVRLYFHCGPEAAVSLVGELTAALNRFQTPFQLKTPTDPALYGRTDALVLYVGARYFPITARIVEGLVSRIPLEAATPLFTKRLWPGVGAAVDPGSGESFGSHRCRLAAEGIVGAWRRDGSQDTPSRLAAVAASFAAARLDLQHPWLGPGGADLFVTPDAARLA